MILKGILSSLVLITILLNSCAPLETLAKHDFSSGNYRLKSENKESSRVYVERNEDSLTIYTRKSEDLRPDKESARHYLISKIHDGDELSSATFSRNKIDFDLSTIVARLRPSQADVPYQLNADLNAALYLGLRKDYFSIRQNKQFFRSNPFVRQIGFDAGLFGGIGISFISPTNTAMRTDHEYDGIVFQKGAALFFTLDKVSVGIAIGFDNLLGPDSKIWIYNNRPWIGLALGIANF